MKNKLKKASVTKTYTNVQCPCQGTNKKCKMCEGTGMYQESHYIFETNGIAIDGDTLK